MGRKIYTVYLSSTLNDLKDERDAVTQALSDECVVKHSYRASEDALVASCLNDVAECDLYIGILGLRYGHVPKKNNPKKLSITELEYRHAAGNGIPRHVFLKDPAEVDATDTDGYTEEHPPKRIKEFRNRAGSGDVQRPAQFKTVGDLTTEVVKAFNQFKEGRTRRTGHKDETPPKRQPSAAGIRSGYLAWLREECEKIVLLGRDTRERQNVRLGQVYVPALTASRLDASAAQRRQGHLRERQHELLLDRLGKESIYVPGAPGSGKSTFCRWVALCVARGEVPFLAQETSTKFRETLPPTLRARFPLFVELRRWAGRREGLAGNGEWHRKQLEDSLAGWIDATTPGGLTAAVFREQLSRAKALLVLDGVDEVPEQLDTDYPRRNFLTGLADALPAWHRAGHRVLLTSRPYGVEPVHRQRLGLPNADLEGLPLELQRLFVHRWYAAAQSSDAQTKAEGLLEHLGGRPDLAELRPNPMLLTALCVKYDEGQRLPGDLYRLYDSVVGQVLYKRYATEPERDLARLRLAATALAMHQGPQNRRTTPEAEVSFEEIDDALATLVQTDSASEEKGMLNASERRERLLSDSGLLLPKGDKRAGFYHFTFQEFLAATRLRRKREDVSGLLARHAGTPAWRRSLRFLFCAIADTESPERALEEFAPLAEHFAAEALARDPIPALLLADCLEVGHARNWNLKRYHQPLRSACEHALQHVEPPIRAQLWRTLGLMGLDDRRGVGLKDGLPDIDWVDIPAGEFRYGRKRETATIDAFRIARYPVTNLQFQAFIHDGGFDDAAWWRWPVRRRPRERPWWSFPNHPWETVSWFDALAFCKWLTTRLHEQHRIDQVAEIRLPTAKEWERAARGTDGREYPWGDEYEPGYANIDETAGNVGSYFLNQTSAVGIYPSGATPEPERVLDLSGNVWEWCLDKFDPTKKSDDSPRVLRGGSWGFAHVYAPGRLGEDPAARRLGFGFRVVCGSPIR